MLQWIERFDVKLARRATGFRHDAGDALLPRLSNAANHAKLWLIVAALLASIGGRRARRAAQRGLLSVGAASLVTNAVFKPLVPRPRPGQPSLRLFPSVRLPTSSSFPSGHAASAAAFATGTMMESPALGVPVGALAGAVAYSRVSTGVHFPSDVVVGACIGMAVAVGSARVWPLIDDDPAQAPEVTPLERVEAQPSPTGHGLCVVVNAAAGPRAHEDLLSTIRSELPDAEITEVDDVAEISSALERAAASCSTLGVVGGDGTVNEAARVALDHDLALAVFPGGTLNHFARDLGIDSADDTIQAIRDGLLVRVDTATIDGRFFLNTASFGSYSEFVQARNRLEDRVGKWPAALVALARTFCRGVRFEMELDGEPMKVWMAFIGNCEYDPPGFAPATRNQLDDGLLDIRLVDGTSPGARLRLVLAVLTGSVANSRVYVRRTVERARIATPHDSTTLAADGEIFEAAGDFTVEKNPQPLRVHVPPR